MSNSVTFKGISSTTLSGLIISELGDITKPSRRSEVVKIDGRDGDIVTYQGYETVKRSIKIGLFGSYDINAISNFFDGEGDMVFSNESSMKYQARIVNNIDYERLVRFRTAKVDIILQPFKHLATESNVTGSTSPLSVTNQGYMTSKPIITIVATAGNEITLKLAGVAFMTVTMPPEGTITIDNEALNCYNSNADKNQYVEGYFIELASGSNSISWVGTVTSITIKPNSRWL